MKDYIKNLFGKITTFLKRFSFKTGIIILSMCIPFYIISFAQMALDFSYTIKGLLWVIFFGLAKTFQYAGLAILGVEGVKRLKKWWNKTRIKNISEG